MTIGTIAAVALLASGAAMAKPKGKAAAFQLNTTSWEYTDERGAMLQTIDAKGNYLTHSGPKHVDHGTAVMKGGKACFTSAMTKDGEQCWTAKPVAIGGSMATTSDKGGKLTVKRVKYTPIKM